MTREHVETLLTDQLVHWKAAAATHHKGLAVFSYGLVEEGELPHPPLRQVSSLADDVHEAVPAFAPQHEQHPDGDPVQEDENHAR